MKKIKTILLNIVVTICFILIILVSLAVFIGIVLDMLISINIIQNEQIILFRNCMYDILTPLGMIILVIPLLALFVHIYKQRKK